MKSSYCYFLALASLLILFSWSPAASADDAEAVRHLEHPTAGDATLRAGARELLEAVVAQVADAEQADT
jgi:hypothetical protein